MSNIIADFSNKIISYEILKRSKSGGFKETGKTKHGTIEQIREDLLQPGHQRILIKSVKDK